LKLTLFDTSYYSIDKKEKLIAQLKDVLVLIYIFDGTQSNFDLELKLYVEFVRMLQEASPNFKTFVFIHKMDQISERERSTVFQTRRNEIIEVSKTLPIEDFYGTSIWDETLYQSWCALLSKMITNLDVLQSRLEEISANCECQEIVVFEKTTFGIIAKFNSEKKQGDDLVKYERLTVLLKQTKWNYSKMNINFGSIVIKNPKFTIFFQEFTPFTYIMLVYKNMTIDPSLIELNVDYARNFFKKQPITAYTWNI